MECNNLCFHNEKVCAHCRENHVVSSEFYRAKRFSSNSYVTGYLVKNKEGEIEGILNEATHFHELAYIDENTLEMA